MKKQLNITWIFGVLTACVVLLSSFQNPEEVATQLVIVSGDNQLKKEAFEILDTKCNVCHRKKNPFMVFNEKNMSKRARKIYNMVFVERKMPKGNEVRLTNEEYFKLEKWLFTQNIY